MIPFNQLSYWEKNTFLQEIDYLIVGAGIVGLSSAIHLKQLDPKAKVLILERSYLPSGGSSKNAGFACIGSPSEILADLKKQDSRIVFETIAQRWEGLQLLRKMLGDIPIDFQQLGSYELFRKSDQNSFESCVDQLNDLNKELETITGIPEVFKVDRKIIGQNNFLGFHSAISSKAEGQIDSGKMIKCLHQLAVSKGVTILNCITVQEIQEGNVVTNYGPIQFKRLGICTNGLAQKLISEDVRPVRAQVIVTSPIENLRVKGIYHFDEGYYYFRNIGDRILFGGGRNLNFEEEETDELNTSDQLINHLSSMLEEQILPKSAFTIEHQWAGTMGVGASKNPIVKQMSEHQFCAVRMGGMGVAIGTMVGEQLASLMNT